MSTVTAPRPARLSRPGALRALLVGLALAFLLMGCSTSGGGDGTRVLSYQRVWPDGKVEQQTIWSNGRIEMKHGDMLERVTIPSTDVTRIQDALKQPIPTGSPDDSPKRTLTLADGTVITAPRPDPGTVTELLERLLDTHSLG